MYHCGNQVCTNVTGNLMYHYGNQVFTNVTGNLMYHYGNQVCTNPRGSYRPDVRICVPAPNISGSSVWDLLRITFWRLEF